MPQVAVLAAIAEGAAMVVISEAPARAPAAAALFPTIWRREVAFLELLQRIDHAGRIDGLAEPLSRQRGQLIDRRPTVAMRKDDGGQWAQAVSLLGPVVIDHRLIRDLLYQQIFLPRHGMLDARKASEWRISHLRHLCLLLPDLSRRTRSSELRAV